MESEKIQNYLFWGGFFLLIPSALFNLICIIRCKLINYYKRNLRPVRMGQFLCMETEIAWGRHQIKKLNLIRKHYFHSLLDNENGFYESIQGGGGGGTEQQAATTTTTAKAINDVVRFGNGKTNSLELQSQISHQQQQQQQHYQLQPSSSQSGMIPYVLVPLQRHNSNNILRQSGRSIMSSPVNSLHGRTISYDENVIVDTTTTGRMQQLHRHTTSRLDKEENDKDNNNSTTIANPSSLGHRPMSLDLVNQTINLEPTSSASCDELQLQEHTNNNKSKHHQHQHQHHSIAVSNSLSESDPQTTVSSQS